VGRKIAYVVSRFPTIAETFILYEILELERLGLQVEIFPLIRQNEPVKHAEVEKLAKRIHYNQILSVSTIAAQIYWLFNNPRNYLEAWWRAISGNFSSPKFLTRALVVVPLAARFARQMQALSVEHVHAHWATHPTLAAYVIRQLTGLSYTFTAHAHDIYVERPMLKEKIQEAESVVTISDYNKELLQQLYGESAAEKIVVIHCGIDPTVFQPRAKPRSSEQFTIICVASLKDYKGHPYLIEACAQLKAEGVRFRCILVGDGQDRSEIEAQISQLGLSEQVLLLGFQPRNRVNELLSEADVMVLPSIITGTGKKEGIPVALMEALAIELPVVTTAISGIPELIEDGKTGLLVPERDARALAAALLKLYRSSELGSRLAAAGRSKVLEDFNLYIKFFKLVL